MYYEILKIQKMLQKKSSSSHRSGYTAATREYKKIHKLSWDKKKIKSVAQMVSKKDKNPKK